MHNAPSVSYPVGRSRFQLLMVIALWAFGAAACLLWWCQAAVSAGLIAASAATVLGAGAAGLANWWHCAQGQLAWDGSTWRWSPQDRACEDAPHVVLDLQSVMLLCWRGGAMPGWIWLERAGSPARWPDLRRAVYSRARTDARASASTS